jgi:hypothetical protein
LEGLPGRLHIDIIDHPIVDLCAQRTRPPLKTKYDVRTKFELATIGSGYKAKKTTTTHSLRINVPQVFHLLYTEDKENLSRRSPGLRYSIVKEGNAPFG